MPVAIEDRPTQTVRDEVIDKLIMNYSHGELSYEAFERRLDIAMESQDNKVIAEQAQDLPLSVDKTFVESKKRDMSHHYFSDNDMENGAEQGTSTDTFINVFSGSEHTGVWKVAKEIRILSVFSGADLDFTQAQFSQKETTVKIFSFFSGDNIYVPEDVNVVSKAFCIFGSVNNKAPGLATANSPTLIIEGCAVFSGIDIKLKQTLKERFVAFADSLKRMFS
ncbi:LiaF domain-containing protein [Colwellia sp. MEBiC06753]